MYILCTVHSLKNDMGKHTLCLEEILGFLKEKSPVTQTSDHSSVPISEKLKDTLGGVGNRLSVREGTLPPYTSPMPPQDERLIYCPLSKCDKNGAIL